MKFISITTFIILGCFLTRSYFLSISDKITTTYAKKSFQKNNLFKEAREGIYYKTAFLKESKKDTIYILERYTLELAMVYGRIWTKKNKVAYSYRRKAGGTEMNVMSDEQFSKRDIELVTKWDTTSIRKQENDVNNFIGDNMTSAYRGHILKNKVMIDHITFRDLFVQSQNN